MGKYERLINRYRDLNDDFLIERDCLDHFFECETGKIYETIIKVCKEKGYNRVFDIGCAYGHQSECFLNTGVDYIGIDQYECNFWNSDLYEYKVNRYPYKIESTKNDIAISVLCLTWNCYLVEGEKTLREQLQRLKDDFGKAILYIANDKVDIVKEYMANCEKLDTTLYYFSVQ